MQHLIIFKSGKVIDTEDDHLAILCAENVSIMHQSKNSYLKKLGANLTLLMSVTRHCG